jgi:hypothetical protein
VKALLCSAVALALLGCAASQPIENVTDAPVITRAKGTLRLSDVATAIQRAGRSLGWQMSADAPGLFTGRLARRHHVAVIEIEHGTRAYSIRYRDSANLDARDGRIHPNYNTWINRLDKAIRAELELL